MGPKQCKKMNHNNNRSLSRDRRTKQLQPLVSGDNGNIVSLKRVTVVIVLDVYTSIHLHTFTCTEYDPIDHYLPAELLLVLFHSQL